MAQAIWADEFARSVPDIEEDQDEDLWHVRMSPDDVKVLSLTRLDDLFRLSLVDAETEVWQPGMKSWVPLGVVAGIEDEEPAKPRTLKDAIRASVTPNASFKPAKRKRGNDFDPLNPNL